MALLIVALSAAPARASWRASTITTATIAYNQGITFDRARGDLFFDGVTSSTNSGLYRTDARLVQTAANGTVIPATPEGYNHAGDLSFDARRRRILLPLECYHPELGGNTCGVGAIGVADPVTLRLLYYVNLDRAQIQKAMWVESSPDGRWIWTSSGTHLLVYRAADVRPGVTRPIRARDLGAVLPTASVTGATFYEDALTPVPRLMLALNLGTRSEVVSYATRAGAGAPGLIGATPRTEITLPQSFLDQESEGLATTGPGELRWLMLPTITSSTVFSRIRSYRAAPRPPSDGVTVQRNQRLTAALARGLRLTVVCNNRCSAIAAASVKGRVAGAGSLRPGTGSRTLTIVFDARARRTLRCLRSVKLSIAARSVDTATRVVSRHRLTTTLVR